jgi:hypothetical protein
MANMMMIHGRNSTSCQPALHAAYQDSCTPIQCVTHTLENQVACLATPHACSCLTVAASSLLLLASSGVWLTSRPPALCFLLLLLLLLLPPLLLSPGKTA